MASLLEALDPKDLADLKKKVIAAAVVEMSKEIVKLVRMECTKEVRAKMRESIEPAIRETLYETSFNKLLSQMLVKEIKEVVDRHLPYYNSGD